MTETAIEAIENALEAKSASALYHHSYQFINSLPFLLNNDNSSFFS